MLGDEVIVGHNEPLKIGGGHEREKWTTKTLLRSRVDGFGARSLWR